MAGFIIESDGGIDPDALFAAVCRHCPGSELISGAAAAVVQRHPDGSAKPLQFKGLVPLLRVRLPNGRWLRGEVAGGRFVSLAGPPPVFEADIAPLRAAVAEVPGLRVALAIVDEPGEEQGIR